MWQPIETAPKDGRHVLLAVADDPPAYVCEAYFDPDGGPEGGWYMANTHWTDAYDGRLWNPTHWQPLPAPPKEPA